MPLGKLPTLDDARRIQTLTRQDFGASRAAIVDAGAFRPIVRMASGSAYYYKYSNAELTRALSDASSGDLIWIAAGTLSQNITVPAGVEIIGAGNKNTILSGTITNNGILSRLQCSGTLTNNGTLIDIVDSNGYQQMSGRLGIGISARAAIHADASDHNVIRISSPSGSDSTVQLYSRDGASYDGYAILKDRSAGDFEIRHDTSEGTTDHTYFAIDISEGDILLTPDSGDVKIADGNLVIEEAGARIDFFGASGGNSEGITYEDSSGTLRYAMIFPGSNVVAICNRIGNGVVQIRANTATAGSAGEVTAAQFEDSKSVIYNRLVAENSITITETAAPSTPSANAAVIYLDSTSGDLMVKFDSGNTAVLASYV